MKCKHPGCKSYALKSDPDGLCFWHSPATAEQRRQAGRRGGARGKLERDDSIETIQDVKRVLAETIRELRTVSTDVVSRGRCIGYLCSILLTAIKDSDIEQRISALEARFAEDETA